VDMVVVDPPRAGLTPAAIGAIKEVAPRSLVYVSCNPSTLARDLRALEDRYLPREMVPFDFFPQTAHFEVLTVLEKR
jgi:23S rRNA (uracil1939-C5)-methyltransferase